MHYYQFNIGDYARDTSHLSLTEHGIYRLLIDWCYLNEKPITTEKAIRVSRGNPIETQSVLSEFFTEVNDGWIHQRVMSDIQEYHKKAETNKLNGAKGGRPKTQKNPDGSQSQPIRNPNQEPITNNHKPSKTPLAENAIAFTGTTFTNIDSNLSLWSEAYPAISLQVEIAKAAAWLAANPKNRKSNYARFLTSWFVRAQDRAPAKNNSPNAKPYESEKDRSRREAYEILTGRKTSNEQPFTGNTIESSAVELDRAPI